MKLKKVYFDAYKSLLKKELNITNGCIGFVGINESGKSNLLGAIRVLGNNNHLNITDTPRMAKENTPKLRFDFELTHEECLEIKSALVSEFDKHSLFKKVFKDDDFTLIYNITYNKKSKTEDRFFTLNGLELEDDILFLNTSKSTSDLKVYVSNKLIPLNEIGFANVGLIADHNKFIVNYKKLDVIKEEMQQYKEKVAQLSENIKADETDSNKEGKKEKIEKDSVEIEKCQKALLKLETEKKEIENLLGDYNLLELISLLKEQLLEKVNLSKANENEINISINKIQEIEAIKTPTAQQNTQLAQLKTSLSKLKPELLKIDKNKAELDKQISLLEEPLDKKYTSNTNEFYGCIKEKLDEKINNWLPKVVYWEHSDAYILESNTQFSDILDKNSLNELSRPLVNVFRICLGIKTHEELKQKIEEIQQDESERSRLNDTFNEKIDEFLNDVWSDYDQKIRISLEEHQIRIQFFDPECKGASYYSMQERSQGCQTFISFLLTIGAEAKNDVIKDTVLILDEPETHLHPSGVRYMLKELIKIAENGNIVVFATHSIFMIDRNNFNRHIILTKDRELTKIQPSSCERMGFFLQEEVLYGALNINLTEDFKSSTQINFIFEGEGDAVIFRHFFEKVLPAKENPFKNKSFSFYHGGGCKNITKYFNSSPIHLGTKWIVILDKDKPADSLKELIEGRYKEYINKDIFVFQYERTDLEVLELEDILPENIITETYNDTFDYFGLEYNTSVLEKFIKSGDPFIKYNDKIIAKFKSFKKEEFKAKYKELLNSKIENRLKEITDSKSFSEVFEKYETWVKTTISKMNGPVKK